MTRRRPCGGPGAARGGFSLLELLVALAIFALAATALLGLAAENARTAGYLETRALAGMVANNLAVETRVTSGAPTTDTGTVDMAGRSWRWSRQIVATDDPALVRVDIGVEAADAPPGAVVASLAVFRDVGS